MKRTIVLPLVLVAALVGFALPSRGTEDVMDHRFEVIVLGTAQDGGLPHLGCEKDCCREARESGTVRYPSCLGIHDREDGRLLLLEATPAIEAQVALLHHLTGAEERGRRPVDGILLTHAHIGHYLGLAALGREVAATKQVPVFTSPAMAEYLRSNGPWSQLVQLEQIELREFVPGVAFEPWEGLRITPVAVPHRDEFSDTMAFKITGPGGTVLFAPDVDSWERHPGLLDSLLDGVTVAYVDATFYDGSELPGRDLSKIPHPFMQESMERLASWVKANPGSIRFLHLNHSNPVLRDRELQESVRAQGFRLAERGERVRL